MGKEQEIIRITEDLGRRNRKASGVLGIMANAALQRFEPGGRKAVPRLYNYFQVCREEGVPLETIRKVVRIARS